MSFKEFEKKVRQWVQAQLCSSNRLDLRSKWIEEVLFENKSKMKASWNEDTIGIKKIFLYGTILELSTEKWCKTCWDPARVALKPGLYPAFLQSKKHVLSWVYLALILSIKKCFIESCDMSSSDTSRSWGYNSIQDLEILCHSLYLGSYKWRWCAGIQESS